ncbi:S-adenosyl-L-methionine-dependent methyltransferase [Trichoderma citrinoviride]|uniref:S-adenosyl-L-methionine-dependent methyltransferase n=1 Tax=Trichoderma citrinoviride TaxID=58853 RepID=A0A2T4B786_9HYPO|nr:S-adenosyl-L-methionine-dependent methyltransferase [Trichoderma citrinoviride]PTB65196.1 S-adenosyl-L-methionine-dependent methyltransferase [Trichoderma citrinoviride]
MMTEVQTPHMYLAQARAATSVQDCMSLYDKWAATYNAEVGDKAQNYVAPEIVAQVALRLSQDLAQDTILDAGCGTGLVGQALAQTGAKTIDGLDLSPAMLKVAKETGVYRNLFQADLTQRVQHQEGLYDLVTCVGTFTNGHVGPDPALREFVRLVKKGGTVIATVLQEFWESAKFDAEVEKLAAEKVVEVVAQEAVLVILRKA